MYPTSRITFWYALAIMSFGVISARLFYWQVMAGSQLAALASFQHQSSFVLPNSRGLILTHNDYPIVSNRPAYLLYAYMPDIEATLNEVVEKLTPILKPIPVEVDATRSAEIDRELFETTKAELTEKLSTNLSWVPLGRDLTVEQKELIDSYNIKGLGFESYQVRYYPEASTSAQINGFVGSDGTGNPKGYFGLEGYYNLELTSKSGLVRQEKDAFGRPILIGDYSEFSGRDGRTLKTNINRSVQIMIEEKLADGLEKYGAVAGEVAIMDPHTGAIIAMAALPSYDPQKYKNFPQETYKIPSISESYEPGSTFKALVMAAAINEGAVTPETTCDNTCNGPVAIGKYSIRTWNNEYHPGQNMHDVIRQSDNTGMIFVAFKLGKDNFINYLDSFGIGHKTGIDLEAEVVPEIRKSWGDIDLATGSFGQGLAVTSVQMLAAFSSLANGGEVVKPQVVAEVITNDSTIKMEKDVLSTPISSDTSRIITDMLVESGHQIGAKRIIPEGYLIAGKSGTAQIPISGHYDTDKTIASFIGYAPAHDPKFVMLVKLREPTSSPWGMETAAPLWYQIAKELFIHLNIPPEL